MQYDLNNLLSKDKEGIKPANIIPINSNTSVLQTVDQGSSFQDSNTSVQDFKMTNHGILDSSEKALIAKEKVIKQLPNMYKNTKMAKYCIQVNPVASKLEFKRVKGLMLNIEKRFGWYLNLDIKKEEIIKCLLIDIKAKSYKTDITEEDRKRGTFIYYAKVIFKKETEVKFVVIPLYDLNVAVV